MGSMRYAVRNGDHLTAEQVADALGNVTAATVRKWIQRGHLTRTARGGIDPASVGRLLEQRDRQAGE